jgi:hypothetical protein
VPKIPKSVRLKWPVGPHYLRWVDGKGVFAWSRFKMKSADWYLKALEAAAREAGDLDRYVGIEMALDGVLASLCAAVDTAGWGLFETLTSLEITDDDGDNLLTGDDWRVVFGRARAAGVVLPSEFATLEALEGSGTKEPGGWLAQLRLLRDQAVLHNVLVRRFDVDGNHSGRLIDVPGLGPSPTVEYLISTRNATSRLVEFLLADVYAAPKLFISHDSGKNVRRGAPRALTDLSGRAGVNWPPTRIVPDPPLENAD